ncbi:cardiolipin synthase [Parasporobacterium paucivorans]|uniref:Cardiolipin synthase n=1 Tax=Parasporobacterium paucivorans DSM 15970 TaxID=1122934 RepID=A0A1M6BEY4_9FIRM|nr:cardiolipin synthase [Parasporobacterium paucivorans]SHI47302.1 cardiolipin synthase [Parasporobacterium paucivorans DSM 15970]
MTNFFDTAVKVWEWLINNIVYINIIFAFIIVFFQRRNPMSVWSWLLVLYFIPIVGFILYIFLGHDYHKKLMFKTKEIEDIINSEIKRQEDDIVNNEPIISDPRLKDFADLIYYNLSADKAVYSENNEVEIYTEGPDKFGALLDEIRKAENFVHIQYYIIRDDEVFTSITDALREKIKEGVEVRILYDAMGGKSLKRKTLKGLKADGFMLGEFFPAALGKLQLRMNYRNHRKIVVIDGKVGFVGGYNIGKEYIGKVKRFGHWRDTHLKITGLAVNDLQVRFALDWSFATRENIITKEKYFYNEYTQMTGKTGIQIVSSGPDSKRKAVRDNYIRLIHKAKKSIYIQTPYLIPDESISTALIIAAGSGVDVRIMIPSKPDHPFVYWATYSYVGDFLAYGVRSYAYEDGFLHSKGMMVDGIACSYGTANMDIRSFELNFEVNAVIYDAETTGRLERIFMEDLKSCREITRHEYEKRNLVIRFKEQISRLLAPLM